MGRSGYDGISVSGDGKSANGRTSIRKTPFTIRGAFSRPFRISCRRPEDAKGRDLRSRHNLAYWLGRDYLGVGVAAVSTIEGLRWRNTPRLREYVASLLQRERPPREVTVADPSRFASLAP